MPVRKKLSHNIPRQIRETAAAKFEKKEKLLQAADTVPALYEGGESIEVSVRKGKWSVFIQERHQIPQFVPREDEQPGPRFCAVYTREGRPRTIVRGKIADDAVIRDSLQGISKKVLEQRPLVSRPGKALVAENGFAQGIKIGLIFAVLLGAFVLFDYVLIPRYPEAILQGANISSKQPVQNYSADAKIFQYRSVTERVLIRFFPAQYEQFGTIIIVISAFIVFLAFGVVYEAAGKGADRRRMKHLPEQALEFKYGFEAVEGIIAESELVKREGRKRDLYNRLSGFGLLIEKKEFEEIFTAVLAE